MRVALNDRARIDYGRVVPFNLNKGRTNQNCVFLFLRFFGDYESQ
jgi:hypothetical protein